MVKFQDLTKKFKPKTSDPIRHSPNPVMSNFYSPTQQYPCPQPQPLQSPPYPQPHMFIGHTIAQTGQLVPQVPCVVHQCSQQPQQPLIQSPQQSVSCQSLQSPMRAGAYDSRPSNHGMMLNNHQVQLPQPQFIPMPVNHVQPVINGQKTGNDNSSYYSNQNETYVMEQNHYQQQHYPNQAQQQQQQLQPYQYQQQHQQQQQQQHHQQQPQQQSTQQVYQQTNNQMELQRQRQTSQFNSPYQQYQNVNQIVNATPTNRSEKRTNGQRLANNNSDQKMLLETFLLIHEKDREELAELADSLRNDLMKMEKDLNKIKNETPKYSVNEVTI